MKREGNNSLFGELLQDGKDAKLAGLGFSLALILPSLLAVVAVVTLSLCGVTSESDVYLYVNYSLTPLAFFLILLWMTKLTKKERPVRSLFRENRCSWKYYVSALALQAGLFPLGLLNGAFLEFLERFGYRDTPIVLPSMNGFGFFGVLFVVAVLPAVFEELIFRGLLLRGLKSFGTVGATLLCGALFAFYHQNPAQTIYQFCCGAAFALTAIRARSVFPTIVAHFVNNAAVLLMTKCGVENVPVWGIVVCSVCLLCSLVWLFTGKNGEKKSVGGKDGKNFFLFASVGIVLCAVNWLYALFTGFGG